MATFSIGGDTVGIVKRTKGSGRDRLNQRLPGVVPDPIEVGGCSFEVQPATTSERREATDGTTTVLQAVAFVTLPVTDDTVAIDFADGIQFPFPGGPVYEQAGKPVVETDSRGRRDHVALVVEWQAG